MKGRRPLRVWFTSYWDADKKPEHCVKAVVRYDILSPAGQIIHPMLRVISKLLELERRGKI